MSKVPASDSALAVESREGRVSSRARKSVNDDGADLERRARTAGPSARRRGGRAERDAGRRNRRAPRSIPPRQSRSCHRRNRKGAPAPRA
eukprot:1880312-Pleurochrysis_carterae.AAC.1